ncbi:HIT domain-containing protein [Dokdonella sp.]|uniref:HIT domain-containing protein n=1 Tax=Dokdonella sp. TaxID=2291710 RepID=UPI003C60A2F7
MTTAFILDARLAADSHPVARFELCDVRLIDDSLYPWLILVPRLPGLRDLIDLDQSRRHQLADEVDRASRLLRDAYRPDKLNVAALGNVVVQLHVHVIARFETDPSWPSPIWGRVESRPYSAEALLERVVQLQERLAA